ncbi:MAG: LacI family DNA-binding transcriptional regulator [Armatimonadetes bacterium]|nr:LacI family DNA-binding transcriptional regulator [Armatimonadota bacterium]
MAITLKDVAREAGVGTTTASLVLRGNPHPMISAGTRERVLDAARRLKYRHNSHARQLRLGRSEAVGILAWVLAQGMSLAKFQAIERAIHARGYRTLVGHADEDEEALVRFAKEFVSGAMEGAILLNLERGYRDALEVLVGRGIPVVSLELLEGVPVDVVTVDRRAGAYLATKHLLELGHRRIAILHPAPTFPLAHERLEGYRDALAEHGLAVDTSLLVANVGSSRNGSYGQGYETAQRLLAIRPLPTAVFCSNDEIAIGVMKALGEAGVRVPDDTAVVGFDDMPVAAYLPVPLTTIAQPVEEQAAQAVALLFDRIENPDRERPPQAIRLKPRLVVRASCGAAAAGRERRADS